MGTHILIEFDDAETESAEYSAPDTLICRNGGVSKLVIKELFAFADDMAILFQNKKIKNIGFKTNSLYRYQVT